VKKPFIILSAAIVFSCNDIENCDTNDQLDFFILRFYDLDTQDPKKVAFQTSSSGFIYGEGFYFSDSTAIGLPLNPDEASITYQFDSVGTDVTHRLTLSYQTNVSIFDPDCPPSFYYSNLDTVNYTFDSLAIPGTITNNQLTTNVEVYFQ